MKVFPTVEDSLMVVAVCLFGEYIFVFSERKSNSALLLFASPDVNSCDADVLPDSVLQH